MQRTAEWLLARKSLYQQIADVTTDSQAASIAADFVDELDRQLRLLELSRISRPESMGEAA